MTAERKRGKELTEEPKDHQKKKGLRGCLIPFFSLFSALSPPTLPACLRARGVSSPVSSLSRSPPAVGCRPPGTCRLLFLSSSLDHQHRRTRVTCDQETGRERRLPLPLFPRTITSPSLFSRQLDAQARLYRVAVVEPPGSSGDGGE